MKSKFLALTSLWIIFTLLTVSGGKVTAAKIQLDPNVRPGQPHRTVTEIASPAIPAADAQNVEFVGHIGGSTCAVAVQGNYAYIGKGPRLIILNISNPANPNVVGKSVLFPDKVEGVAVAGGYVYVADSRGGLRVVDVSDPSAPQEVGFYDTQGWARDVAVAGNYVYIANEYHTLWVVDVSDPSAPREVGSYNTPGAAYGVAVAVDYLYVADGDAGLRVVDVSDPSAPQEVGFYDTPGYARDVAVAGNYAYVADGDNGLRVVDVSDPSVPQGVGFYDTPGTAPRVTVAGNYAYVADWIYGLRVVDVSDPSAPQEVGFYDTSGYARDVAVAGNYTYVADDLDGLRVVDVSDPSVPHEVGFYSTMGIAEDVAVAGGYAYVADRSAGLRIMDVSDPSALQEVGFYDMWGGANGVAIAGSYAYVAGIGLRVVDVSDPSAPVEIGFYDTPGSPYKVAVAGNFAYVADLSAGLRVVDVSDPSAPQEVGFYDTPGAAFGVAVAGNYAYVADWSDGLRVVDVSDPSAPREVGFYNMPEYAWDVAVAGNYAYVANEYNGLRVVDISDPSAPREVGFYDTPGYASGVFVTGNYAYVADGGFGGLRVVDVSDPSTPREVGFYDTPGSANSVTVAGNYAYVADWNGGLLILRYTGGGENINWTLMYYLAGDNDLDTALTTEYYRISQASIDDSVNVIVFYDGSHSNARYTAFTNTGTNGPFWQGELNTGERSTLENFLSWSKVNYPAENYGLIISDHGHGLGGVAYDYSSSRDYLTPNEIKEVFTNIGKVDVIYMAACLVANLEIEYQLRGMTDYYVGSESISFGPRNHAEYINQVNETTTPQDLALLMAQRYFDQYHRNDTPSTISAVRMNEVETVAARTSDLATSIRNNWVDTSIFVNQVTDASIIQRFEENSDNVIDNDDRMVDLYHFAYLMTGSGKADIFSAANALMDALDSYVIYDQSWSGSYQGTYPYWDHNNAHGVSIAFPRSRISFYDGGYLDFASGTYWWTTSSKFISETFEWGPMVVDFVDEFYPDVPDSPLPPEPVPFLIMMDIFLPSIFR